MTKKYYISFLLIGALAIFSILPYTNYCIDKWRVLHNDYQHTYTGISPNKTYMKMRYLLDNKEKYETILMGSSRSGYMDARLIGGKAYNMKFNFALVKMHLQNLKILLKHNMPIKNLWIGINDYDIWKSPDDHIFDFQRRLYNDNIFEIFNTYSFYLLKALDVRDIGILKKKYILIETKEITHPDESNMKTARMRELKAKKDPGMKRKKMALSKPTLLGYTDSSYRIDDVISELAEIKEICNEQKINVVFFFYPSFYKTYLGYNQFKIEEFKRQLVKKIHFHDFYALDKISLDELNWNDSSHFHASIGSYMIDAIKNNDVLVTKKNIEAHLEKIRKMISNILTKDISEKYIYKFNAHIDLEPLNRVFSLEDTYTSFYKNKHFSLKRGDSYLQLDVNNTDPIIILDSLKIKPHNVILKCAIESTQNTMFVIYYKKTRDAIYNESDAFRVRLSKGMNEFNLLIPSIYISNNMRIDLVDKIGKYRIHDFSIFTVK